MLPTLQTWLPSDWSSLRMLSGHRLLGVWGGWGSFLRGRWVPGKSFWLPMSAVAWPFSLPQPWEDYTLTRIFQRDQEGTGLRRKIKVKPFVQGESRGKKWVSGSQEHICAWGERTETWGQILLNLSIGPTTGYLGEPGYLCHHFGLQFLSLWTEDNSCVTGYLSRTSIIKYIEQVSAL